MMFVYHYTTVTLGLNYKNKLVSVLFTHSNLNNCSFFISWLVVLFFLTQRLIFFQEMVGYLSVTYFVIRPRL